MLQSIRGKSVSLFPHFELVTSFVATVSLSHFLSYEYAEYLFYFPSYLNYSFLGEANGIRVSKGSASSAGFLRKSAKGNESGLGKQKAMAFCMTLAKVNPSSKIKSSFRQFAVTYPYDVNVDREHSKFRGTRKLMDARTSQPFGLCRYICFGFSISVMQYMFLPDLSFECALLYIVQK